MKKSALPVLGQPREAEGLEIEMWRIVIITNQLLQTG